MALVWLISGVSIASELSRPQFLPLHRGSVARNEKCHNVHEINLMPSTQ